jgi:hypothetical protein
VLKTLGFSGGLVMALVIVEALAIGIVGGSIGVLLAQALVGSAASCRSWGLCSGTSRRWSVSPLVRRVDLRDRGWRWAAQPDSSRRSAPTERGLPTCCAKRS